jgi:hypothetical protein
MIVHNFNILGVPHHPAKADVPLVVDFYTHLACSLSFQQFIAEPNLSYESLETLKQTGKEADAGGVDPVLRQIQDLLAQWG